MPKRKIVSLLAGIWILLLLMVPALAQTRSAEPQPAGREAPAADANAVDEGSLPGDGGQVAEPAAQPQPVDNGETRRGTTSFFGDTGFWYVPSAEILPARRWSASGLRANWDREQGVTDISHFTATFGVGLGDRAELFGSWRFDTRIARRIRQPLFQPEQPAAGGVDAGYPFVREGWTGDMLGDLLVGVKVNLLSQWREQPLALALRGAVKLPTGDEDAGASTGEVDLYLDGIISGEIGQAAELAAFGGFLFRGNPDIAELPNSWRWGLALGAPTRSAVRGFVELHGEVFTEDAVVLTQPLVGIDGSLSPLVSPQRDPVELTWGIMWQAANGLFIDAGLNWNLRHRPREDFGLPDKFGDRLGRQIRIGYHPGVRVVPEPLPPPPPPPPPPPAVPTVKAMCDPCTVEVGRTSMVTADAHHPDGLPLTYKWSAPTGTFEDPTAPKTIWTAPMQEGPVPVTVTVDDGRGGTASDTVTITVVRPVVEEFVFEDVHFDFDRYSLRPDALRVLDEVVKTLQANPELRITVEGHTCNIGTAEYNLALGERRAFSVRDYLTAAGIAANRLDTVSYGEERPAHDNTREETRRLNRRAAMVVRVE